MVQIRATTFLQKSFNYLRRFSWEYAAWLTIEVFSSLPNLHFEVKNALYNLKNATEFLRGLVINYPDVSVEQKNN